MCVGGLQGERALTDHVPLPTENKHNQSVVYKATARNFNPMMAMAGKITIAEVEELVPEGTLNPNEIHTPGIFVQRIFKGEGYEKRIEQRTVRPRQTESNA